MRILVAIAMLLGLSGAGFAESKKSLEQAKIHFQAGQSYYRIRNYDEAVREFEAGYALVPKPEFLLNIGQTYRMMGRPGRAIEFYDRYLQVAPPTDPRRAEVRELVATLRRQPAAEAPEPAAPVVVAAPAAPAPAAEVPAGQTVAPALAVQPASQSASPGLRLEATPARPSPIRRYWWTIPVGAAVVGVAVGLGVYYGTRSTAFDCGSSIGCIDLSKGH